MVFALLEGSFLCPRVVESEDGLGLETQRRRHGEETVSEDWNQEHHASGLEWPTREEGEQAGE